MTPLISICVPAYKNPAYLQVLLRSIEEQEYKDYEVVVSDDSPDDEVETLCKNYGSRFTLIYQKNTPAKGSPANWNNSIQLANGSWIKIMHDDDWFASPESLGHFASAITNHPEVDFFYSGFNHFEHNKFLAVHPAEKAIEAKLKRSPLALFKKNYIGHPSTTMIRNNRVTWYDEKVKWVVDFEFYIRCLQEMEIHAIPEALVNIGLNDAQITKAVFREITVEIPENIYLINKLGVRILNNIIVYDYYWRMFRNLGIRSINEVVVNARGQQVPAALISLLKIQLKIPLRLLKIGVVSKPLMLMAYLATKKQFTTE